MKFSILAQAILALPALATAIPEPVDVTEVNAVKLENLQCFWTDGIYVLDVSEVQGPAGYAHSQYKNQHNLASKTFSRGTGCDVIQNL
ncbi:hypothetical protein FVER53590_29002 [Fusarium verticillioides]|nr:hypothetical protein FVER53590_29002 [Fusarium verticillioides]